MLELYSLIREAGQLAPIVILIALYYIHKNHFATIERELRSIKALLMHHLEWHSQQGTDSDTK